MNAYCFCCRYEDDVQLAKGLGGTSMRISVEWHRYSFSPLATSAATMGNFYSPVFVVAIQRGRTQHCCLFSNKALLSVVLHWICASGTYPLREVHIWLYKYMAVDISVHISEHAYVVTLSITFLNLSLQVSYAFIFPDLLVHIRYFENFIV